MTLKTGKNFGDAVARAVGSFGKRTLVAGAVVAISFAALSSPSLADEAKKKDSGFTLYPLGETEKEPRLSDKRGSFSVSPNG